MISANAITKQKTVALPLVFLLLSFAVGCASTPNSSPETQATVRSTTENAARSAGRGTLKGSIVLASPPNGAASLSLARSALFPVPYAVVGPDTHEDSPALGARNTWERTEFPNVVEIEGNGEICSGVLIAPSVVLTAAHCFCEGVTQTVNFGYSRNDNPYTVSVLPTSLSDVMINCDEYSRASAIRDDQQRSDAVNAVLGKGDIALLAIVAPPFSVATARVANSASINLSNKITVVGFGRTTNGTLGTRYYNGNIKIASHSCTGTSANGVADAKAYGCARGTELVAISERSNDTCGGDSGGAAFVQGSLGGPDGSFYLSGITSRGIGLAGCGYGGIYVRVDGSAQTWINEHERSLIAR